MTESPRGPRVRSRLRSLAAHVNRVPPLRSMGHVSIDKHSTGMPEIDVHRRTTKVNFSVIVGVLLFFVAMGGVVLWFMHR